MAQIDLKETTIRICDGRLATVTIGTSNAALTVTDKDKHRGSRSPLRIRVVNGGTSQSLTVSLAANGRDITINAATDGGGAITTTPNLAKAALDANTSIAAVASFAVGGTGATAMDAVGYTALATGARTLSIKIGEGNLTFDETKERKYTLEKGVIDDVRDGDEVPVDVSIEGSWEYITGSTGSGTPTLPDALEQRGEASAWVTTSSDACDPYCPDLELENDPACSGAQTEYVTLPCFYFEEIQFSPENARFSIKGKCNATEVLCNRE